MRRAKVRFGLLMAAVGLLTFLILFQTSLQNGLITAFIGAIKNQSAPVLVYTVDGRRNIQGSVVPAAVEDQVSHVDGVGKVGRIGQGTFSVVANNKIADASIIGYQTVGLGSPSTLASGRLPAAIGEAVASESDAAAGFGLGDVVKIEPSGMPITVVGTALDVQLSVTPTLFTSYDTYLAAVKARNPDAAVPLPNVLAVSPAGGVSASQLVQRINALGPDVDALTRADAANLAPGVSSVRQSFSVIFLLYGLVVPFVTGLFFLIITFQKANSLTLLRAIGAPARRLVSSLLIQVVIVMVIGTGLGIAGYAPISVQRVGSIPLRFESAAVVFWAVALVVAGTASALFSARRVLKIDPIAAVSAIEVGK
jgi:putative ABC transport system permease protein